MLTKVASQEVDSILSAAREMPELSCRQLAAWTIDNMGFSVSESTVSHPSEGGSGEEA